MRATVTPRDARRPDGCAGLCLESCSTLRLRSARSLRPLTILALRLGSHVLGDLRGVVRTPIPRTHSKRRSHIPIHREATKASSVHRAATTRRYASDPRACHVIEAPCRVPALSCHFNPDPDRDGQFSRDPFDGSRNKPSPSGPKTSTRRVEDLPRTPVLFFALWALFWGALLGANCFPNRRCGECSLRLFSLFGAWAD